MRRSVFARGTHSALPAPSASEPMYYVSCKKGEVAIPRRSARTFALKYENKYGRKCPVCEVELQLGQPVIGWRGGKKGGWVMVHETCAPGWTPDNTAPQTSEPVANPVDVPPSSPVAEPVAVPVSEGCFICGAEQQTRPTFADLSGYGGPFEVGLPPTAAVLSHHRFPLCQTHLLEWRETMPKWHKELVLSVALSKYVEGVKR